MTSLDRILALFESHGTSVVFTAEMDALASFDVRAALHAAGITTPAPSVPTWPCDVRGCSRDVRANYDGARKPLVAVCSQAPAVCMPVELGFDEVAQQRLSVDALVVAVCGLLGADVDRAALVKVRERHAIGTVRSPVLVARVRDLQRDVFWAGSPRDMDLSAWCARRERAALATLVLVPTAKYVPLEVSSRFSPDELVEVRPLTDLIDVSDSKLALVGASRPAAASALRLAFEPVAKHGLAATLGVARWEDVRISMIDMQTVSIEANGTKLLRTFVELGFVDARKRESVSPTKAWSLLLLFCKQQRIKPSEYREFGKPNGVKKAIQGIGVAMRAAFGLEDHPIHSYSKRSRLWEARFRVEEPAPTGERGQKRGR